MRNFTFLLLLAFLACKPLYAQLSVGVRGGYTLAGMRFKDPAAGYRNGGLSGPGRLQHWHADLMLDLPLGNNIYLQPVVRYITKGAYPKQHITAPSGLYLPVASKITLRYLELPLNVVYKLPLSFGKITAGVGPYVAYSLSGRYDLSIKYNGEEVQNNEQRVIFNNNTSIISTNMDLHRWDAGANLMLGVEFNHLIVVGLNYSRGMVDVDQSPHGSMKNSYVGVSLGVLLSREDY